MRRLLWILAALLMAGSAVAHDVPQSTVQLDIGLRAVEAEVLLPLSELATALQLPLTASPATALSTFAPTLREYVQQHARLTTPAGTPFPARIESIGSWRSSNPNYLSNDWLLVKLRYIVPPEADTERFIVDYDVIVSQLVTHSILVSVRRDLRHGLTGDTAPQLLDVLGFQHTRLVIDRSSGSWLDGFGQMFSHGAAHIASGTDHLLFLIVLLLPAPLVAAAGRWKQAKGTRDAIWAVVKTVSGFTIGHCITLALGALGWVDVPSKPIEVLIATSILVSAAHAWRPMFGGREPWVACGFGLVHGLAFASSIQGLGFDPWTFTLSLLGFNLGIEAMQLAIVAVLLPILLYASHYRTYRFGRTALAALAAACALGWMYERAFNASNPLAPIADWLSQPPAWFVLTWCGFAVLAAARLQWVTLRDGFRTSSTTR